LNKATGRQLPSIIDLIIDNLFRFSSFFAFFCYYYYHYYYYYYYYYYDYYFLGFY